MKYIVDCDHVSPADIPTLGGKAAALATLGEFLLPIPEWFAVKTDAWRDTADRADFPTQLQWELDRMLERFPEDTYFAVRSSALAEDGADTSFAGQFETFLWVERGEVPAKIRAVWASAFSERVKAYCSHIRIPPPDEPPVALVQRMVRAEKAGVAFAANPLCADTTTCVVSAVWGLGSALVDGTSNADSYTYHYPDQHITAEIPAKSLDAEPLNRTVCPQLFDRDRSRERVLTDEEVQTIARLAQSTSCLFGRFQDIEWAFERGELFLLQSRPITTLGGVFESRSTAYVFDNSNIAESYSHTTTPLTFTFIRMAYSGVYEQFCRVFGVSERVIAANMGVFSRMLAFVDNRVYYNLFSWYKMLSLLPGYALNRAFMEQMMGVKEPLPDDFLRSIHDSVPTIGKLTDTVRLLRCLCRLVGNYARLEKHIARFYSRLETALAGPALEDLDANGLLNAFSAMEKSLLKRWDAPLENDFFAMIFHGLLRSLCKKYKLPDDFHNELLTGQGGIISTRPAERIREVSRFIAADKAAVQTLASGSLREIRLLLRENAALNERAEDYLRVFGDRCVDELKLESITLTENPMPFYRAVAAMAGHSEAAAPVPQPPDWQPYLKGHPLRRGLFRWILRSARRTVKNRENLRFERTRLFGRVRSLFLCMGMQLASRGVIDDRRDIFYLTLEEIFGVIDHTAASYDLRGTVELRKREHAENTEKDLPVRIFVNGIAGFSGRRFGMTGAVAEGDLTGIPCCAGEVQATARVVNDPQRADFAPGQILVAKSTDPGWIVLFSLAAGIIVEKGSLLSHAAIVSREMGIPCIISATGATTRIPDGATVQMDGATGGITIVEEARHG